MDYGLWIMDYGLIYSMFHLSYSIFILYSIFYFLMGKPINFNNAIPFSLSLAVVTTVTSKPNISFSVSYVISGKMLDSFMPRFRLPFLSKFFVSIPLKSLDLGKATDINLSIKSYILFPRKVTIRPIFTPSLTLKLAMDFFAFLNTGFWPVSLARSTTILSTVFSSFTILPIPTLITTFSTLGTAITF